MRLSDAVETRYPCPECEGTGHSGNLHDETCPTCDGGGRVHVIGLNEAQKRRYLTDKRFYDGCNAMVAVLRALHAEDVADAMAVALVIHRGRPQQDDVERRYREMREIEHTLIAHAVGIPQRKLPTSAVWPATAHIDPKLPEGFRLGASMTLVDDGKPFAAPGYNVYPAPPGWEEKK